MSPIALLSVYNSKPKISLNALSHIHLYEKSIYWSVSNNTYLNTLVCVKM